MEQAGAYVLQGDRIGTALQKAGYAESTARVPKAAGLSARSCVEAAIQANPEVDPSNLVRLARRTGEAKLQGMLDDPKALEGARLSEIARIIDVSERWYGDRAVSQEDGDAAWLERMSLFAAALHEQRRRAQEPTGSQDTNIDE